MKCLELWVAIGVGDGAVEAWRGTCPQNSGNIFFGQLSCKIQAFC